MLTILRMVEPDNGSWRLAQHGGRDLARALAPLRDLQVRRTLLSRKVRDPSKRAWAMLQIRAEERSARRSAREALRLFVAMPEDGLRRCTRRFLHQRTSIWTSQVREAVQKSRERLWEHWHQAGRLEPADLHGLRIALKRYRYLLLSLERCLNDDLRRSLPGLERMQDELGAWHDGQGLSDWMRAHRGTTGMAVLSAEQEARLRAISKMLSEPIPE